MQMRAIISILLGVALAQGLRVCDDLQEGSDCGKANFRVCCSIGEGPGDPNIAVCERGKIKFQHCVGGTVCKGLAPGTVE